MCISGPSLEGPPFPNSPTIKGRVFSCGSCFYLQISQIDIDYFSSVGGSSGDSYLKASAIWAESSAKLGWASSLSFIPPNLVRGMVSEVVLVMFIE